MTKSYPRVARFRKAEDFRAYLDELGIDLPFDEKMEAGKESPLGSEYTLKNGKAIGNRFCILPMEGWDGTPLHRDFLMNRLREKESARMKEAA